jgi:Fe-S-cluster containining protein
MIAALPKLVCGGCRTCCLGDTITLTPQDNPLLYRTVPGAAGGRELAKGADGNCTYLTAAGCSIHGAAPAMCRSLGDYALADTGRPS